MTHQRLMVGSDETDEQHYWVKIERDTENSNLWHEVGGRAGIEDIGREILAAIDAALNADREK